MANFVDLTDARLLRSANSVALPPGNWSPGFARPEADRIAAIPSQYRKVTGAAATSTDVVTMDAGEIAAVDAAAIVTADDAEMAEERLQYVALRKEMRQRVNAIHARQNVIRAKLDELIAILKNTSFTGNGAGRPAEVGSGGDLTDPIPVAAWTASLRTELEAL